MNKELILFYGIIAGIIFSGLGFVCVFFRAIISGFSREKKIDIRDAVLIGLSNWVLLLFVLLTVLFKK